MTQLTAKAKGTEQSVSIMQVALIENKDWFFEVEISKSILILLNRKHSFTFDQVIFNAVLPFWTVSEHNFFVIRS